MKNSTLLLVALGLIGLAWCVYRCTSFVKPTTDPIHSARQKELLLIESALVRQSSSYDEGGSYSDE